MDDTEKIDAALDGAKNAMYGGAAYGAMLRGKGLLNPEDMKVLFGAALEHAAATPRFRLAPDAREQVEQLVLQLAARYGVVRHNG